MRIFIDTADVAAIRTFAEIGVVDGVTTNPSLIAQTGRKFEDTMFFTRETSFPSRHSYLPGHRQIGIA